ncbi:MAG: hypothetical protein LBT44_08850 [Clostridiales bacterium]|nr:hypothetical protein [Clostridiales bacterium]
MSSEFRDERPPELPNAAHAALTLVLDTSPSMAQIYNGKTHIQLLCDGVNEMISSLKQDGRLSKVIDLSIITFNDKGAENHYQNFAPLEHVQPVSLATAGESTYAAVAIEMALNDTRSRCREYGECWKPWIILFTDGKIFDDLSAVGSIIHRREEDALLHFICLGVPGYDAQQLFTLTDKVAELIAYDFKGFFNWVAKSMKAVSVSAPGSEVSLPPPTANTHAQGQNSFYVVAGQID